MHFPHNAPAHFRSTGMEQEQPEDVSRRNFRYIVAFLFIGAMVTTGFALSAVAEAPNSSGEARKLAQLNLTAYYSTPHVDTYNSDKPATPEPAKPPEPAKKLRRLLAVAEGGGLVEAA